MIIHADPIFDHNMVQAAIFLVQNPRAPIEDVKAMFCLNDVQAAYLRRKWRLMASQLL